MPVLCTGLEMTALEVAFIEPFTKQQTFSIMAKGYWRIDGKITNVGGLKFGKNGTGIKLWDTWDLLYAVKLDLSHAASGEF